MFVQNLIFNKHKIKIKLNLLKNNINQINIKLLMNCNHIL